MSNGEKNRAYVENAREQFHQYTQGLLRENEKLRAVNTALESDKRRLELEVLEARAILRQKDELRRAVEVWESDRAAILDELETIETQRDELRVEIDRLRSRFAEVEQENARFADKYHEIEAQSSNLSNLYVASYQLHASVDRETVLNTILEIVINLIGSEEIAIYDHDPERGEFRIASSFGVDSGRINSFHAGDGPLGQRLLSGEVWINDGSVAPDGLTATVPLKIGDTIIGAILVFRLLGHKAALQPVDHELFELLAVHASTALHCATLHGKQEAVAR